MEEPIPSPFPPPPGHGRLDRLLEHRLKALRRMAVAVPREIETGLPETLPYRIAVLDRWIARELDLAGGMQLPPPEGSEVGPRDGGEGPSPSSLSP